MSVYAAPEYRGFVEAMRADPKDLAAPLACADWLDEHDKAEHAGFVRGCVRMAQLRDVLDECAKADIHYTDPQRAEPDRELMHLVRTLRPLINRHCHEWTGGAVRKFDGPTVYDWPGGFVRAWSVLPLLDDQRVNENGLRKLAAVIARQPVARVLARLPASVFAPPDFYMLKLAERFPGIEFDCPTHLMGRTFKVPKGGAA